jgi:GMP synthase (glutamine-hydrolysing)
MKRVLVIIHVWDNPAGYLGEILQEHGITYDVLNAEEKPLPDLTAYNAIVALGGPQHIYEEDRYPYFVQEKTLLRHVIEQDIPYLGVCLGGQLLAGALGSTVKRNTTTEFGFVDVQFTEEGKRDALYQGLPGYQKVFQWHEDTFDLPAGAVLLASNEHTTNQAFRYGRRCYGLQYHIEVDPEMLDLWLSLGKKEIINTVGIETLHELERSRETQQSIYRSHTRIMFENFLRISELI